MTKIIAGLVATLALFAVTSSFAATSSPEPRVYSKNDKVRAAAMNPVCTDHGNTLHRVSLVNATDHRFEFAIGAWTRRDKFHNLRRGDGWVSLAPHSHTIYRLPIIERGGYGQISVVVHNEVILNRRLDSANCYIVASGSSV